MNVRRILKSVGGAIFYFMVYLICQRFVGTVAAYMVSSVYSFVYTYSSIDPTAGVDALDPNYFEEILTAVTEATTTFVNDNLFPISIVAAIFTLLVYFLIFKLRRKKFCEEVGISKMNGLNYPIAIILGITLNFLVMGIFAVLPIPEKLMEDYANASAPILENAMAPAAIIFTVIITPLFEEIVFRGLIYSRLKRCMPMLGAMILSSFVFGAMHGTSVVWVTYACVFGFFLAWIYEKCESLLASILLHMGFNAVGILTAVLPEEIAGYVVLALVVVSVPVSVLLIFAINKRSNRKIEIGMPKLQEDNEN